MKILNVKAKNFGSYKEVEFNVSNQGLTLIQGPTGSGKSTLPDIISWCLFGVTAKDTNVDDVCSWDAEEPTEATVDLLIHTNATLRVHRSRRGNVSDFFYLLENTLPTVQHRGRNAVETQAKLSALLGGAVSSFIAASIFYESSPSALFFLASAKERRTVLERLTDLSFCRDLDSACGENSRKLRSALNSNYLLQAQTVGSVEQVKTNIVKIQEQQAGWESKRCSAVEAEIVRSSSFEEIKASKIAALVTKHDAWEAKLRVSLDLIKDKLSANEAALQEAERSYSKCTECGTVQGIEVLTKLKGDRERLTDQENALFASVNPFTSQIKHAELEENRSEQKVAEIKAQKNPHAKYLWDTQDKLKDKEAMLSKQQAEIDALNAKSSSLDQLYDLSFVLRGTLLQSAVSILEDKTNQHLATYFDSEFRVAFDATDGANIEVSITKEGHSCVFRQLSKGQRQLLKLCFAVAVMEASAHAAGVHYDQLFFDEALDGLDPTSKVKAFSLFEMLAQKHSSVFVIEHASEFQELFTNKWTVELTGAGSVLTTDG